MGLVFRIQKGLDPGNLLPISAGMTLGRSDATLKIADPKISSRHARIDKIDGKLLLIDDGSHNGIMVAGEKVKQVELRAGLIVHLGNTVLEVLDVAAPPDDRTRTLPPSAALTWRERLAELVSKPDFVEGLDSKEALVHPFNKTVVLEFIRGPQLNTAWVLTYGPRLIGRYTPELPILEPDAPEVCFKVFVKNQKYYFETTAPDKVQLNEKSVPSEEIHDGDIISVFKTQIRVGLKDEYG